MMLLAGVDAHGQEIPGSPGPPPPRPLRLEERSPSTLEAENYSARGMRLGSFLLFASLEADLAYNDNVYALPASSGPVASLLEIVQPTLELRSSWGTHMLNAYARGAFGFFNATPVQNYADYSLGVDGRYDIYRDATVYGGLRFAQGHEIPGLPNTVQAPIGPTVFTQATGAAGYYQKITRFSVRAELQADRFRYVDNGLGLAQGVVPNNDRDRTEFRESLRFGYEFLDGYEIWVRGRLNQRVYLNPVDAAGFARDSSGWDAVVGISIDLGGLATGEFFAGYLSQTYVDPQFKPLQGPQLGLAITWHPLQNLWVKPYAVRTINETAYVGNSGYLNTSLGVTVNYDLLPNVKLEGRADYTIADYQSAETSSRYDQYYTFAAGLTYFPVPQFFIGPRYQFIKLNSNQSAFDYAQNVLMLRIGARL